LLPSICDGALIDQIGHRSINASAASDIFVACRLRSARSRDGPIDAKDWDRIIASI